MASDRTAHGNDRFIGFTLAGADAFFELNENNELLFAGGATGWLGAPKIDGLIGRAFIGIVHPNCISKVNDVLQSARDHGRSPATAMDLALGEGLRRPVILSASILPDRPGRLYVTVRSAPKNLAGKQKGQKKAATEDQFVAAAADLAAARARGEGDYAVTMVEMGGLTGTLEKLDAKTRDARILAVLDQLSDLAAGGQAPCRLGGDRFAVLTDGAPTDKDYAALAAAVPEGDIKVSGQSLALDSAVESEEDLTRTLVYALTHFATDGAKLSSLSETYKDMIADTRTRLAEFKSVVAERKFDMVLQPIVGLQDRQIHHYEALTRLHAGGADASPYKFITFAEEVGVIPEFDLAMCKRAIERIEQSQKLGHHLSIAVNISGRSLMEPVFVKQLLALATSHGHLRDSLMFEVTESARLTDLEATNKILTELRKRQFAVCLDDFGAGASGFQYLRMLEVDYVKIDGAYVLESVRSDKGRIFLRAMTDLCHALGIRTIGECVETEEHASYLRAAGVAYGQGWLFKAPSVGAGGKTQSFSQA